MLSFLEKYKKLIDSAEDNALYAKSSDFELIVSAMRYSALGGKRLRGALTLEFAKMFGCSLDEALPYSVAVECIQAYSLIHDDLPCMDNDDMRRGKPSCHIAFGEANALLAGDALLTHSFNIIAESDSAKRYPERAIRAISVLSFYAGYNGMVGGQVLDLEATEKIVDETTLSKIHMLKTAALIKSSVLMGCACAGADSELSGLSEKFAEYFGLSFQIIDDILDFDGNYETCELNSYVKVHGIEKSRADARDLIEKANKILSEFDAKGFETENLSELLDFLIKRMN